VCQYPSNAVAEFRATTTVRPGSSPSTWRRMKVSLAVPSCEVKIASFAVTEA